MSERKYTKIFTVIIQNGGISGDFNFIILLIII